MILRAALSLFLMLLSTAAMSQDRVDDPGPHRVAVLNVVSEGADDALAVDITRVIKAEARGNAAFTLVQQEDIALYESLLLFGCEDPTPQCMTRLAESLEADRLIYGRLVRVGELFDISIEIFDARKGRSVERWQKRFTREVDTIGFFKDEMGRFIGGREAPSLATLRISSNVRSAAVTVDGAMIGRTPFMTDRLAPGVHRVEVSREGYNLWRRDVTLAHGEERFFEVTLHPTGAVGGGPGDAVGSEGAGGGIVGKGDGVGRIDDVPPKVELPEGLGISTYGWVSTGVGAAALVSGGVLGMMVNDAQRDFDATDIEREAVDIKARGERLAEAANALYALGGAAVMTGVILIVADSFAQEGDGPAIAPTPGGASLLWQGRW